jgi:hypothetical protein
MRNGAALPALVRRQLLSLVVLAGLLCAAAVAEVLAADTTQRLQSSLAVLVDGPASTWQAVAQQSAPMAPHRPLAAMARQQIAVAAAAVAAGAERRLQHPRLAATAATVAEVEAVAAAVASA